jgi:GDPmannose 4,6-dehydratase
VSAGSALITGISGQDGSYLAEQLLGEGMAVHGLLRAGNLGASAHLRGRVIEQHGDLRDAASVTAAVRAAAPTEIYHLGALSHVTGSPVEAFRDVVAGGTRRVLEAAVEHAPQARVFCASSAEVFGAAETAPQDESTPVRPRNAYGEAKAEALAIVREFRDGGAWVSAGIFYNHESPRRPRSFVTRKVTWHAAAIARGRAAELRLGSLDAQRDWGYAPEYVDAARRSLRASRPDDFVLATGVLHSVRELVEVAFTRAGVAVDGRVTVDPELVRPSEPAPLVGNPANARRELGWEASMPFEAVIAEMVDRDLEALAG